MSRQLMMMGSHRHHAEKVVTSNRAYPVDMNPVDRALSYGWGWMRGVDDDLPQAASGQVCPCGTAL
jgi:hypothetical protein